MSQNVSDMTPRTEQFAALLAAGRTLTDAAAALGVSERTAYRWLRDPRVKARVTEIRAGLWRPIADQLRDEMPRNVVALIGIRDNPDVAPSVRVRAAEVLMVKALRTFDAADVLPRIAALEAAAEIAEQETGTDDLDAA